MTTTNALYAALAEPADLEPLRLLVPLRGTVVQHPLQAMLINLFRFYLGDFDDARRDRMRQNSTTTMPALLIMAGASSDDMYDLFSERAPSPKWNAAALRLAQWNDENMSQ
jgi:hypothetical protein